MKQHQRWASFIALILAFTMMAAACGSDGDDTSSTADETGDEATDDAAAEDAADDSSDDEAAEDDEATEDAAASGAELPYGLTPGKPYDGTEVTFLICCEGAAQFQVWRASRPEFERLTGISVEFTDDPLGGLKDKIVTESVSNPGSWDTTILFDTWLPELSAFLEPASPELLDDLDVADFPPATADLAAWDGVQYGVPVRSHVMMFYYRQDILDDLGIAVPTTFDELLAAAEQIDASGTTAGFVLNWGKQSSVSSLPWQQILTAGGGSVFDDAENPTAAAFNSPEGIAATQLYQDLLQYSPDGAAAFNEADMRNAIAAGDAAMTIAWSWSMEVFQNPEVASEDVIGNIGFTADIPGASSVAEPFAMAWPIGISSSSENKEVAMEWIRWMTNPDLDAQAITEKSINGQATVVGNRISSLESPAANEANAGFSQAMTDAYKVADHQPIYEEFSEVTEIIETMLSEIVAGGDVEEALAQGEAEVNAALAG